MHFFLLPLLLLFNSYVELSSSKSRSVQCEICHKSKLNSRSQEKKYSKTKLGNFKDKQKNERNTQKECQGRQTKRLQNKEKDCPKIELYYMQITNKTHFFFKIEVCKNKKDSECRFFFYFLRFLLLFFNSTLFFGTQFKFECKYVIEKIQI